MRNLVAFAVARRVTILMVALASVAFGAVGGYLFFGACATGRAARLGASAEHVRA